MSVKLHNVTALDAVVIATEDIGGGNQAQRVKVILGDSGVDGGDLSATNPLPVNITNAQTVDLAANILVALRALIHPIWEEAATGRLRVVLDPTGGVQTLGTVATVGSVSAVARIGSNTWAESFIYDQMHAAWAGTVRRAIS